jgi:acylphosphatase
MTQIRARIYVSGRVQGVFFRWSMKDKAQELGVKGYVRNLDDGRVYAVVEGEEASVRKLVDWSKRGPPHAEVEDVKILYDKYSGEFQEFNIEY